MESTTSLSILFISSYNSTTGVFTVPPSGDGVYYFSTYVLVQTGEAATFDMRLNDDVICTTLPDHSNNGASDYAPGSCSTVVDIVTGNMDLKHIVNTLYHFKKFSGAKYFLFQEMRFRLCMLVAQIPLPCM